jgi:cell division GTPase FtsZ
MGTKSETVEEAKENVVDDISDEIEVTQEELEQKKLADLRAKMAAKQAKPGEEMPAKIVAEKTRSIRFGVIGSGQAGSRLAERFYELGYPAVAINTARQDLEHIKMPHSNKLLLDHGLGGAAKELDIGLAAAEMHRDAINELVHDRLSDAQLLLFCTSLGGGSGAGSAEVLVDLLSAMERPVVVITVLPMSSDDAQTKHNALVTLAKFTKYAEHRKIDNLIVVDNARIETLYADVGQLNFFEVSNQAIVDPIDQFNTLSSMPSSVKGLDPTEFGKLFTDGRGLTVYGMMKVPNYAEDTAIAEAVIDNLNGSMLASGFNLKQARYVGTLIVANKDVWAKIPNAAINYAMSMINDVCGNPLAVFRGIYTVDMDEDVVKVYSMFSGLGLPEARITQLKQEAKERMAAAEEKDEQRNIALKLDAGEETISAAEAIKKRIQAKKSSFGKLHNNAVIDRRKK